MSEEAVYASLALLSAVRCRSQLGGLLATLTRCSRHLGGGLTIVNRKARRRNSKLQHHLLWRHLYYRSQSPWALRALSLPPALRECEPSLNYLNSGVVY